MNKWLIITDIDGLKWEYAYATVNWEFDETFLRVFMLRDVESPRRDYTCLTIPIARIRSLEVVKNIKKETKNENNT